MQSLDSLHVVCHASSPSDFQKSYSLAPSGFLYLKWHTRMCVNKNQKAANIHKNTDFFLQYCKNARTWRFLYEAKKKSRIRETKHLWTDADSSTNTTVGWTKNTQKAKFFEKHKKSSKTQKLKNV